LHACLPIIIILFHYLNNRISWFFRFDFIILSTVEKSTSTTEV